MLILALDPTTKGGSVAVARDDDVLALVEGDASRTHGERLPGEMDEALRQAGIRAHALDLLCVANGPGAFTGLRIGLAAIQGLAMVTGVPVVGVSALDALAHAGRTRVATAPEGDCDAGQVVVVAWMDAQRGEVFSAAYRQDDARSRPLGDPIVAAPRAVLARLPADGAPSLFIGDGAVRYRAEIADWSRGRADVAESTPLLAPALAWLGRRRAADGQAGPPHALQLLYVRRSDAELERSRRLDA